MNGSIYDSRQRWTVLFVLIAIFIVIGTVYVSNSFCKRLAEEERNRVEIWAEATTLMSLTDEDSAEMQSRNIDLQIHIMEKNTSIPILVCDEKDNLLTYRNFEIPENNKEEFLKKKVKELKAKNPPIIVQATDQYIYYDESTVLKRLSVYPYIQLAVVAVFIIVALLALMSAKKAEQNKVWAGLSKETAHQLGTPISSLIGWVDYLKNKDVNASYINEMEKDVKRLEIIAERFSKIGSNPDLAPHNVNTLIKNSCDYMSARVSSKVELQTELTDKDIPILTNDSLFSWVIENLTKNAVDAMEGEGRIVYHVEDANKKVYIDITDTGKGIAKSKFKTIFNPGYTTKTRGWGLGLSLVKRIIESYPGGRIYVKNSELGAGTTFRIELRKYNQ